MSLSFKFILFARSVKIDLGPLSKFPLSTGTKALSIEGAGETLQEERALLPESDVQARQISTAQVAINCTQQPAASSSVPLYVISEQSASAETFPEQLSWHPRESISRKFWSVDFQQVPESRCPSGFTCSSCALWSKVWISAIRCVWGGLGEVLS